MKALGEPNPDLLNKMLGQLDGVRQLPPIARDGAEAQSGFATGFWARLFGFTPSPVLRFAAVAACLLIVAESAALLKMTSGEGQGFQTASSTEAATGPQLILHFQPDTKFGAFSMLLSDLDATVVKGPMPDGAFVIALPEGTDVPATITIIKGHGDIVADVEQGS
jgi:hypothetical protein